MNIGQMIRRLRRARDITQKELGQAVGVAESTISLYESGRNIPDLNMMRKLALFFNVSLDYLAGDEVEPEKTEERIFTIDELELIDRYRKLTPLAQQTVLNLISSLENMNNAQNQQSASVEKKEVG